MGISRRSLSTALYILLILTSTVAFAQQEPIASKSGSMTSIDWSVKASGHDRIELRVTGPEDFEYAKSFPAGKNPTFRLNENKLVDGAYTYELRLVPKISNEVKKALATARANNDDAEIRRIQRAAGLADPQVVQSGTITVLGGSFVAPGGDEGAGGANMMASDETSNAAVGSRGTSGTTGGSRFTDRPTVNDQVIPDDLIVQASLCVGFDCVDGESFGVDTIRMKENNLRVHFEDTSTSAGFASNDWRLVANEQPSGGANMFAVEDSTAARNPFLIEAAAPANALYVDSTGNIGLSQSAPGLDLHITTTDTPAMRYEQTSAGGFTAQTWDIGANEANFFVRDLTGGSRLSFRIRPGAPTSSIDIAATGKVGMGTASPSERLHIFENADANSLAMIENTNTGVNAVGVIRAKSNTATVNFQAHGSGRTLTRFGQVLSDWSEMLQSAGDGLIIGTVASTPLILGTNSTARMTFGAAGGVTVTGDFTATGTKAFAQVDPADSSKAIHYVALEGPEAGTYYRGTAKTVNGVATIALPGYFARITESERMTVQLTPVGSWGNLYVASKTPEQIVIKAPEGAGEIEFDYFVQGVRKGYLDFQVERENNLPK